MTFLRAALLLALALLPQVGAAYDLPLKGPRLGASTDLGQTWSPDLLVGAARLPLTIFRDEVFWQNVETDRGRFVFDMRRTLYPDLLPDAGAELLLLVNNPHPAHDGGTTPWTEAGTEAFARYTTEVLNRFPDIRMVEVGNEMNSGTFAWGPGWDGSVTDRADSYLRLLKATALAVRASHPGVKILGGAAHSIPIAWFREMFDGGAAAYMDALVIHPYTVRPEQLARQIALLRHAVPQTANMPLAVTEFGQKDAATASAYMVKSYCQQALSGVTEAMWYPLNPRGDGLAALLTAQGGLTPAGETFRLIRRDFEGQPAETVSPDPFTYGCRFGENRMVLWGEPRQITLMPGVRALDLSGQPVSATQLSPDVPLILEGDTPLRLGQEVRLGPNGILADSWNQFAYPGMGADPFQHLVRQNGQESPLQMRPGQEVEGVPWTPYLGTDIDGVARATAEWVLPSAPPAGPIEIVTRYVVPQDVTARAEVRLAPWDGGIVLTLLRNGQVLRQDTVTTARTVTLDGLSLRQGDVLDVVAAPNGGGAGLRIILRAAGG